MTRVLWCGAVATIVMLATSSGAFGADVGTTPPSAVLASLRPGGLAFEAAVDADFTSPGGTIDTAAADGLSASVTFGPPHRYVASVASPATVGGPSFGSDDLGPDSRWLAVERRHGKPYGFVVTDADGSNVGVGNMIWLDAVDALPAGTVMLVDDPRLELYAISADLTTVTAVSAEAADVIGATPVDATRFRQAKAAQAAAAPQETGAGLPDDSVGSSAGSVRGGPTSEHVPAAAAAIALVAAAGGLALAARHQRRRRPVRTLRPLPGEPAAPVWSAQAPD